MNREKHIAKHCPDRMHFDDKKGRCVQDEKKRITHTSFVKKGRVE